MAYILGYIYADGSIHKSSRGSYLSITSTDLQTIKTIKRLMSSGHNIYQIQPAQVNRKLRYILRIGNKKIYNTLEDLGLFPSKSLTIRLPQIPRKYFKKFVLGYFDGDGCVYLHRTMGKRKKLILRKLSVIFTSGSELFLSEFLQELRKWIKLRQTKIYKSKRCFQLRFFTKDSLELFKFMYRDSHKHLFLKRKYDIFQKYFHLKGPVVKWLTQRSAKPRCAGSNPAWASK